MLFKRLIYLVKIFINVDNSFMKTALFDEIYLCCYKLPLTSNEIKSSYNEVLGIQRVTILFMLS